MCLRGDRRGGGYNQSQYRIPPGELPKLHKTDKKYVIGVVELTAACRLVTAASPLIFRTGAQLLLLVAFGALAGLSWSDGGYDFWIPLGWFALMWSNDTGAYLVGRKWGRHPLAPTLSPGRTWEGWAGGAVVALLVGGMLHHNLGAAGSGNWLVLASLVSVFGPLGDVLESLLKRRASIKDSGQILPGHGGILDRFDSHLLAAPLALLYLIFA